MVIDFRNAEGHVDKLPDLATDLVRLGADVIVTATEPATRAAKKATAAIPILMVAINSIRLRLVTSTVSPGPARMSQGYSFSILSWWPKGMGSLRKCCRLCAEWRSYPTH